MAGIVTEIVRAIRDAVTVHVIVLMLGIAVVVVILSGGAVPMAAVFIGAARMGKDRGYQEGEQQEDGKKFTHKISSFYSKDK